MEKQKKNSANGITLIALVISIIVMLILAGVSINALVGDNGVLTQTQYASFLNEMSAVEEAVQLWRAGEAINAKGVETTAIPTKGMCNATELQNTERLVGEIGYYRVWSIGGTKPAISIESAPATFNSEFEWELVFYPAGVQDLYYLNNELIGIAGNKKYIIDASTGLVYSMTGIGIKGIRVYSSAMAKAVMNGDMTAPLFAEAEVSGGSGEKLAGNITTEYVDASGNPVYKKADGTYVDANGNPVNASDVKDNKANYNANGFQIIATPHNNNIFKLYNNGDLYGKGLKGPQLNSSNAEMSEIDTSTWQKFDFPNNIGTIKKTYIGLAGDRYYVDSNDDLWVSGSNGSNRFGLTQAQQIEFTGRETVKVDLNGAKVEKVFPTGNATYIVTKDKKLLTAGYNHIGQLAIGSIGSPERFTEVKGLSNVENIEYMATFSQDAGTGGTFVKYSTGEVYVNGKLPFALRQYSNSEMTSFTQIWSTFANDIKEIFMNGDLYVLMKDGSFYVDTGTYYRPNSNFYIDSDKKDSLIRINVPKVLRILGTCSYNWMIECEESGEKTYYCFPYLGPSFGNTIGQTSDIVKLTLPQELQDSGVKDVATFNTYYFLGNNGKVYGCGVNSCRGVGNTIGYSDGIEYCNIDGVERFYDTNIVIPNWTSGNNLILLKKSDGYYTTGNNSAFGEKILQKSWKLIASNVKYFNGKDSVYVDRDGYLWVSGTDSRCLGLGDLSKTSQKIPQYVKVTDANIAGKVKEARTCNGSTYVLTNDNQLWAAGRYANDAGGLLRPGWSDAEDKTSFVKILDNVKTFSTGMSDDYGTRYAFTTDGKAYTWGVHYNGMGIGTVTYNIPTEFTFPSILGSTSNIRFFLQTGSFRNFCVTNAGKVYISGSWYHMFNGGNTSVDNFTEYTYGITLNTGEEMIKAAAQGVGGAMFLTNQGRLFGYGAGQTLGIGDIASDGRNCQAISGIDHVTQVVAGPGWYVVVKEDGTVWGTGSNTYGILGRWIGIDRSTPNSRYKTAFEWVECPELEI